MMKTHITESLPFRNIAGKPARTAALVLMTALLSLTVFAGTMVMISLKTGLNSLGSRLGADLMVVPAETAKDLNYEDIVLHGSTGEFYMDVSQAAEVMERDGVGQVSAQFFLASANSSCCSVPVQLIGFDPETDFTVTPWIKRSYSKELKDMDIVIGSSLNALVGDTLTFYGCECHVAAKLENTGTSFDTAVFTNENTIKQLMASANELKMKDFGDIDPEKAVSCLLINVSDGYTAQKVRLDINVNLSGVKAVQTKDLIAGMSESIGSVADIVGGLMAIVWTLGLIILLLAYNMSINGRKKEFAVLRIVGASRKRLAAIVMQEALLTGILGAVTGTIVGMLVILPFSTMIENKLGLPFLLPDIGKTAMLAALSIAAAVISGSFSAAVSAFRISRIDTALILRGDD